jgi:hypothetical protein
VQFIRCAGATFCQSLEAFEATAGVFQPGLEALRRSPGLVDLLWTRSGGEFGEQLPLAIQFGDGSDPFDFQQAAEQFRDRLSRLHVLPFEHAQFHQAAINRAADIAHPCRVDRADERLPRSQFPPFHTGGRHRNGRNGIRAGWPGRDQKRQSSCNSSEKGCFAGFVPALGPNRRSWFPPYCHAKGYTIPAVSLIFAAFFGVLDAGDGFS